MTSAVTSLMHSYKDLMDNQSGKSYTIDFNYILTIQYILTHRKYPYIFFNYSTYNFNVEHLLFFINSLTNEKNQAKIQNTNFIPMP